MVRKKENALSDRFVRTTRWVDRGKKRKREEMKKSKYSSDREVSKTGSIDSNFAYKGRNG